MGRMARATPTKTISALRNVSTAVAGAPTAAAVSSRHPTEKETADTAAALTTAPPAMGDQETSGNVML